MLDLISRVSIGCALACFIIYIVLALKLVPDPREKLDETVEQLPGHVQSLRMADPKEFAELVKALASLVDSLVKAGPALWSLIGSMLFLLIAALAAGAFTSP